MCVCVSVCPCVRVCVRVCVCVLYSCRVLVVYMAVMHLMVFGILYYNAHHVHYGCDPTLDHLHKGGMVPGHLNSY